ncbi:MAG TPA: antibiotic biosynthesis monooxygenase [Ktedonobacterales bacterium]|nr:antibiotic biosynthesis monooxygenase [Ktedonobacterales bacterium]
MYTVVRLYKTKPGAFDQISEKVQAGFISIISSAPGFRGYYMVNTLNDTLMTITMFDDQAGAYQSTTTAAKWIKANIADLIETPPTIIAGEATIHETQ